MIKNGEMVFENPAIPTIMENSQSASDLNFEQCDSNFRLNFGSEIKQDSTVQEPRLLPENGEPNSTKGDATDDDSESETDSDDSDDLSGNSSDEEGSKDSQLMKERWKELDRFGPSNLQIPQSSVRMPDFQYPVTEVQHLPNEQQVIQSGLDDVLSQFHQGSGLMRGCGIGDPRQPQPYHPDSQMRNCTEQQQYVPLHSVVQNFVHDENQAHYDDVKCVDFPCQECGKVYNNRSSLRSHMKKHNPDEDKKFKCEKCSYSSHYHKNLLKHIDANHSENSDRYFRCEVCEKKFYTEHQLSEHQKIHTVDNTYTCEHCAKQFKTKLKLKYHVDVHNPEKPYICDMAGCDRAFRTPKYLKNHKDEFHKLQPKRHGCPVDGCKQIFQRKSHLKRHMSTHDGEKNYHCAWPDCNRSFRSQETLSIHFFRHTGEKPFKCELCEFSCRQKSALSYHYKHTHAKDVAGRPLNCPANSNHSFASSEQSSRKDLTGLPGSPTKLSGSFRSNCDVYAFTELDSQHSLSSRPLSIAPACLDDSDLQMENQIDGIINHLDEDTNLMPLFDRSQHRKDALALRIDNIVGELLTKKSYDFRTTQPLSSEEISCAMAAMREVGEVKHRKRKSCDSEIENMAPKQFRAENDYASISKTSPSMVGVEEKAQPELRDLNEEVKDYPSPPVLPEMQGDENTFAKEEFKSPESETLGDQLSTSVVEDSMALGLDSLDCGDDDNDGSSLPALISSVAKDIDSMETASLEQTDGTEKAASNEKDFLDQVLEDLKVIERDSEQRQPSSFSVKSSFQSQESVPASTVVGSTGDQQQPKSLDSSLWSESGYSSGHDSGGVQKEVPINVSSASDADKEAAFTAASLLVPDLYHSYYGAGARQNPYPAYDAAYGRAGLGDLSQAYRASTLSSAMGDHLRSLTALAPKYMDPGAYVSVSSQLQPFPDRSSLSGLASGSHIPGVPGWPPSGPRGTPVSSYTGLEGHWVTPTPTDYTGQSYADYLGRASSGVNPFDTTGGKVDAYRSALNDYRSLTQTPSVAAAADLYSQMAVNAGYEKYSSLYSGQEALYGAGQRTLGLSNDSPFQAKRSTPTYTERSYIPGPNPFYPQASQYYLGRQFAPPAPTPFPDPYRSPVLPNMPFTRYPF